MVLRQGTVHLTPGPHENGHRPAIDPLFRTAARAFGRRVVDVILSGSLDDGVAGLSFVVLRGGVAIAQVPGEAIVACMPLAAIENVLVSHVLPVAQIGPMLAHLASEPTDEGSLSMPDEMEVEDEIAELDAGALAGPPPPGRPAG